MIKLMKKIQQKLWYIGHFTVTIKLMTAFINTNDYFDS